MVALVTAEPATIDLALRALADGNRRAILRIIRSEPQQVGSVAEKVGLSQQATSHHLGVLRRAGLATSTRDATRHLYVLNTDGLAAVRSYLDDFWPTKRPRASHRVPISGAPGIIHPIEEHHP